MISAEVKTIRLRSSVDVAEEVEASYVCLVRMSCWLRKTIDSRHGGNVVWTTTPLRAQTPLNFSATPPQPFHVEAALIMPSVVNVYPRTVYTR